jgi:hypothetical protein
MPHLAALATLVASLAVIGPMPARAGDTWSTPFPGVRLLVRSTNAPNKIRAVEVSLCHVGIKVRATRPSERGQTVGAFAQAVGAQLAINGDLFSTGFIPSGMAVGRGQWWGDPDNSWEGYVAFGADQVDLAPVRPSLDAPLPWMTDLVSGRPQLLGDGQRVEIPAGVQAFCGSRAPRSAVGFSRDGSKLYLAVVDRTPRDTGTTSRGMTCTEMADLMKGLGAWEAMNLDGGGSTQLWVRGKGYVNDPSGNNHGAGLRVVANHLAIFASGLGNPGSCPLDINPLEDPEPERDFPALPGTQGPIDLDGDGRADVCVRGPTGVQCALGQASGLGPAIAGPPLSDASGWSDLTNLPFVFGDLDGDGRTDLCARANAGVRCWRSTGGAPGTVAFGPAIVGPPYADATGFAARQYQSTLRMADVDGDGRSDVCIRTATRFRCDLSTGDGFGAQVVATALSNATGFSAQNAYGTLQMGDLDGDGKADVCARSPVKGMLCWKSNGTAFATEIQGPDWTDAAGWGAAKYWRTIRLADVDGDGKADLCARTAKDFRCYRSTGKAFSRAIIGPKLGNANGWHDATNYETIRLADIDGDGDLDLCARGDAGVTCWPFTGAGFGPAIPSTNFSDGAGWSKERFYATMRLADIDGDGRADLCARASAGLRCHLGLSPSGAPFGPTLVGPAWSDASGFDTLATYGTLAMDPLPPALGAGLMPHALSTHAPLPARAAEHDLATALTDDPSTDAATTSDLGCASGPASVFGVLLLAVTRCRRTRSPASRAAPRPLPPA